MNGVKAKLVSAVCMLLVAATMVVSSTYAWFTLSTAPEVSGITTAVGANGALEIRLNADNDPNDNHTPGNIVDLSSALSYGLDKVTLLPSVINETDGTIDPRFLMIPQYGANGKPSADLTGERTEAGKFDGVNFFASAATGVRAVGVSSGLTDRQYAYRNAKYAATTAANQATTAVATSLNTNGAVLGNIVIKKSTQSNATYTPAEVAALGNIIDDLQGAIDKIETAYEEMIVALAASGKEVGDPAEQLPDVVYSTIRSKFADGSLTLAQIATNDGITLEVEGTQYTVSLTGTNLLAGIDALQTTIANVTAADTAQQALVTAAKESYAWEDIDDVLDKLIVMSNTKLNGESVSGGVTMEELANSVMNDGINITLEDGAGAYVEIAAHCGNYSANVTMTNVQAGGFTFESLTANMATNSTQDPKYLTGAQTEVAAAGEPSGESAQAAPMTEFYGFIIDLGFKTNAANSNLLLQTEAVDRIYEDNNNEATQGKGSYMTYKATTTELTTDQVKGLMECVRIVFFVTDTREILGEARLDTENATIGADGVTAKMYMYKAVEETVVDGDGNETTTVNYVLQNGGASDENNDSKIVALPQNAEVEVSVLVYLDGETIGNDDVAATDVKSVTGSMNLQFASDAELKPMEYGDLHTPDKDTNN